MKLKPSSIFKVRAVYINYYSSFVTKNIATNFTTVSVAA